MSNRQKLKEWSKSLLLFITFLLLQEVYFINYALLKYIIDINIYSDRNRNW
jgi:hypothetical protein